MRINSTGPFPILTLCNFISFPCEKRILTIKDLSAQTLSSDGRSSDLQRFSIRSTGTGIMTTWHLAPRSDLQICMLRVALPIILWWWSLSRSDLQTYHWKRKLGFEKWKWEMELWKAMTRGWWRTPYAYADDFRKYSSLIGFMHLEILDSG